MNEIIIRLAARCEEAGRSNNEDNFIISSNLTQSQWGFEADKKINLSLRGTLLVVCDGMGGMNAGEVASEIAVRTIKEFFSDDKLTDDVCRSSSSIKKFIENAIIAADTAIKEDTNKITEHKGMGSTIVLAWFINGKVYIGWCGDSRAYCYNPINGLQQLSHDHSYVQELVDAGKITADLAFNHPNSNVITRSLGDPNGIARPDVKEFDLHNNDIILLCSDGLCGYVRDAEIEATIKEHQTSMVECRDALWSVAENAPWGDNVTIELLQVISGAKIAEKQNSSELPTKKHNGIFILLSLLLALIIGVIIGILITGKQCDNNYFDNNNVQTDSILKCDTADSNDIGLQKSSGKVRFEEKTEESYNSMPDSTNTPNNDKEMFVPRDINTF